MDENFWICYLCGRDVSHRHNFVLGCCGTPFCSPCLDRHLDLSSFCPHCRDRIPNWQDSRRGQIDFAFPWDDPHFLYYEALDSHYAGRGPNPATWKADFEGRKRYYFPFPPVDEDYLNPPQPHVVPPRPEEPVTPPEPAPAVRRFRCRICHKRKRETRFSAHQIRHHPDSPTCIRCREVAITLNNVKNR